MAKTREELKLSGVKPKKSLGQNFLVQPELAQKIVQWGDLKNNDLVIEVGSGTGILTQAILNKEAKVVAVEKDRRLVSFLKEKFSTENKKLKIIEGNILKTDVKKIISGKKYKVIANLPYNISLPVIRMLLEAEKKPELMVLMVQKEVGQRICSKSPKMAKVGVYFQALAEIKKIMNIGKGNFFPKPKVDSVVLKIKPKKKVFLPDNFFKIVSLAFSNPRKQIINNLSPIYLKDKAVKIIIEAGINPKSRAENLTIDQWIKLAEAFALQVN